ncbi:DUF1842 domain-containing protein [Alteriqipengyuania sp. 357]
MAEVGYYIVDVEVAPEGGMQPGAPNLTLKLGVNASNGEVNGQATLTQSVRGGDHEFPVSGVIHHTGFGEDKLLVALTGHYVQSVPPPAIGAWLAQASIALAVDDSWNGTGSYTFGHSRMSRCKVTNTSK